MIDWTGLSLNPSIFEYDYKAISNHIYNSGICEGIMANRFHPKNVNKWYSWGFDDFGPIDLYGTKNNS